MKIKSIRSRKIMKSEEGYVVQTEPRLLVSLHLNGQAEVGQLDGGSFGLGGQQKVLWLGDTHSASAAVPFS